MNCYVKELKFTNSAISKRHVTYSVDKVCYIQSDGNVYDKNYLTSYDFEGYGYAKVATEIVDHPRCANAPSKRQQVQEATRR